jgi:hypothetical protein
MAGSFANYAKQNNTQVTFHYVEGHTESFSIPMPPSQIQQQIMDLLNQPWLTFHLVDQTVMISTTRLVKVEIEPSIPDLQGPGVFYNCQKMTAMQRNVSRH